MPFTKRWKILAEPRYALRITAPRFLTSFAHVRREGSSWFSSGFCCCGCLLPSRPSSNLSGLECSGTISWCRKQTNRGDQMCYNRMTVWKEQKSSVEFEWPIEFWWDDSINVVNVSPSLEARVYSTTLTFSLLLRLPQNTVSCLSEIFHCPQKCRLCKRLEMFGMFIMRRSFISRR